MSFNIRQTCLWIHRYTGLLMAAFLIMAGITGSLLAFHDELDDWFNRDLAYSQPATDSLDPLAQSSLALPIAVLHDKVIDAYPEYNFSSMPTSIDPGQSAVFSVDRTRGEPSTQPKAPFQEVYVNPYSGDIIGTRDKEQWAWRNTMWKVFWLHRDLLLGDIGKLILGIIALVWTINCFIGFYLTFPRATKKSGKSSLARDKNKPKKRASFIKRWLPAWKIRTKTNTFKLNYDLHHAFGLWLWVMLFIIAWSSVGFNLKEVYQPVMQTLVGLESRDSRAEAKPLAVSEVVNDAAKQQVTTSVVEPEINIITKANSIAYLSTQAAIAAQKNDVTVEQLLGIRWAGEENQWQMRFRSDRDVGKKGGASSISVDAATGEVTKVNFGYQSSFGNKTDQWLSSLHMAHIGQQWGHLLYQLFLMLIGLAVATLTATGVYLWYKGRQQRLKSTLHKAAKSDKLARVC